MKIFNKLKVTILVFFLAVVSISYAAHLSFYTAISCANGYTDAYVVTTIYSGDMSGGGCIESQSGVDCNGARWIKEYKIKKRNTSPVGPYDLQVTGVNGGFPYYVNVKLDANGGVASVWGHDGFSYYEAELKVN